MNFETVLALPVAFVVLSAILSWCFGAFREWEARKPKALSVPEDPIVAEALRLAREEVEELDWRFGTGEKPEHIIRKERAAESTRKAVEYEKTRQALAAAAEKRMLEAADEAATDLAKLQAELDAESERDLKVRKEIRVVGTPNARQFGTGDEYAIDIAETEEHYVVRNGLGQVVYEYPVRQKAPPIPSKGKRERYERCPICDGWMHDAIKHGCYPPRPRKGPNSKGFGTGTRSGGPG